MAFWILLSKSLTDTIENHINSLLHLHSVTQIDSTYSKQNADELTPIFTTVIIKKRLQSKRFTKQLVRQRNNIKKLRIQTGSVWRGKEEQSGAARCTYTVQVCVNTL